MSLGPEEWLWDLEDVVQPALPALLSGAGRERRSAEVAHAQIPYDLVIVDARTEEQRERDGRRGSPEGHIVVVLPGHGMTARGPEMLTATCAFLCRSKIALCVDIIPARGGDVTKARALGRIVQQAMWALFPALAERQGAATSPLAVTVLGWSHGGGEALQAAQQHPRLFPQVVGLCPTGLVDRHPLELLWSFALEVLHIFWIGLRRQDPSQLGIGLRLGFDIVRGLVRDLVRGGSLRKLLVDIGWACRKVLGEGYLYPGEVVLVLGREDTVIRWQDAFPECAHPEEIPHYLAAFRAANAPAAHRLAFAVIEGDHMAPETRASAFVGLALDKLGQLDRSLGKRAPGVQTEADRRGINAPATE